MSYEDRFSKVPLHIYCCYYELYELLKENKKKKKEDRPKKRGSAKMTIVSPLVYSMLM